MSNEDMGKINAAAVQRCQGGGESGQSPETLPPTQASGATQEAADWLHEPAEASFFFTSKQMFAKLQEGMPMPVHSVSISISVRFHEGRCHTHAQMRGRDCSTSVKYLKVHLRPGIGTSQGIPCSSQVFS